MKGSISFKPALVKLIVLSTVYLFTCLTGSSVWATGKAASCKKLNQLEEFHKRDGLPNLFYKIKTSRQVRIAYLGGSITAAEPGWRDLTFSWFRLNFPQTSFYQTNAAIGGTGSALGVFRLEQDVLQHNPDLLFVEFAVNDGGQPREKILRSMEGIVRKCWNHNPELDIIFVYTAVEQHCKNLVEGKIHPSVLAMEELADYYGIPSVHMGIEVARLYAAGKLVLSGEPADNKNTIVFTKDHTHPLAESGHPIYAATVARYLAGMQRRAARFSHRLGKSYVADNWENARMLDLAGMEKTGNWEKLPAEYGMTQKFSKFLPALYRATPGSSLRFNFSGKVLALFDLMGPGTGKLKVVIDGRETGLSRFDSYCVYYRLGMAVVADTLEEGLHTAEITVLDGGVDKENIIFKDRVSEMHKSPKLYEKTDWYAGNILVVDKVSPSVKMGQGKPPLLPADWDPKKAADLVLQSSVKVTAPQIKGAHDAEFVLAGNRAFIVAEVNELKPGEAASWPFVYASLSVVNMETMKTERIIPFARGGQAFSNDTLPPGACFVPRIIRKDNATLRCYFASEEPSVRQSQIWYIDFDIPEMAFSNEIHRVKIETSSGVYDMQPRFFHADAVASGFTRPAVDFGMYIFDSFKIFDSRIYTTLNNYPGGQNALALMNRNLDTITVVGHFNNPREMKLTESAVNRLPDGTWMAVCRQEEGSRNYAFTTSRDGINWEPATCRSFIPDGTSSKPTFEKFRGIYYLGWQESTRINGVNRSVFNIDVSADGISWERKYRFETEKSFQYPSFHEHNGSIWFTVTQGDHDASRKEYIVFGKLE